MKALNKNHYDLTEVDGGYSIIIYKFIELITEFVDIWDLIYFKSLDSVWIYVKSIEDQKNSFTVIFNFKSQRVELLKGDSIVDIITLEKNDISISYRIIEIITGRLLKNKPGSFEKNLEGCVLEL